MIHNVADIIEYNGEWYLCAKNDNCRECSLSNTECGNGLKSDIAEKVFGQCSGERRSDNTNVVFKKLAKIGKSLFVNRNKYQLLDIKNRGCVDCAFEIGYSCGFPIKKAKPECNCGFNGIYVKIKQNQEDMKEKDEKLSNSENIGKNLRPFNLEVVKSGRQVYTRDGRKARIICFDKIGPRPIVALVSIDDEGEEVNVYHEDGSYNCIEIPSEKDLMMLPEKREGWINIVRNDDGDYYVKGVFHSEELARNNEANYPKAIVATVKVEWKE